MIIYQEDGKPSDLNIWHIIKTCPYVLLHLCDVVCLWTAMVTELCGPLVLLNKVSLTMILWIEVTNVAMTCDELLKVRLLVLKVRLCE